MTDPSPDGPVVFDAEPLVALFCDEPGSDAVERHLLAVERGDSEGYVSEVNLAEVRYVVEAIGGPEESAAAVETLADSRIRWVGTGDTWKRAARYERRLSPALGDAFALATAEAVGGTLLAGPDDDYDDASDVDVVRFREDPG